MSEKCPSVFTRARGVDNTTKLEKQQQRQQIRDLNNYLKDKTNYRGKGKGARNL